jgi:hypothetical protein
MVDILRNKKQYNNWQTIYCNAVKG